MKNTHSLLFILLWSMTCLSGLQAQSGITDISADLLETDPSITDISQLADVEPIGINDLGWVVGHYPVSGGQNQLFVWIPPEDITVSQAGESKVILVSSAVGLTAAGISDNRTIIYNVTDPVTNDITGGYRLFNETTGLYEAGVGAEHFQMKDISGSWVAADVFIGRSGPPPNNQFCPFSISPDYGVLFGPENLVRAMVFNIEGGGPGSALSIAFQEAELCGLSSRAYTVKASASGDLLYVGGESFGKGQGDERFTSAHAMVYSQESGTNFTVLEMLEGTPGQIREVNTIGEIAGTWFTPGNSQTPNSQRGFKTAIGCLEPSGGYRPFVDIYPDRSVLPNGINDEGWTVGNYLYGAALELRTFMFQSLDCHSPQQPPVNDQGVDILDFSKAFKDMTEYGRAKIGLSGWQKLSTAKDINNNNQVIGRGIGPDGNTRAYLFAFNPCELSETRGIYPKGNFDPINPAGMEFYNATYRRIYEIGNNPGDFATLPRVNESLLNLFRDNDNLEGEGTEQGWYVKETATYGPQEPAALLTNIEAGYPNNARYAIESNFFPVLTQGIFKEAYLSFKVWSHQEKGIYDHVKIEIRSIGDDNWNSLAYISESYDPDAPYSNFNNIATNQLEEGWANYFIDLSTYINKDVQLRFSFISDVCETGDGIMFKDFRIHGISEEIQQVEFTRFLDKGTADNRIDLIPAAIETATTVGLAGTVPVGGGLTVSALKGTGIIDPSIPNAFKGLAPILVKSTPLVVGGVVIGVMIYYYYKTSTDPQPAYAVIFTASPEDLATDPDLKRFLDHKKEVFFDGFWMTDQLISDTERTLTYGAVVEGLEMVRNDAIAASEDQPAYLQSFTNVSSKEIALVIPTETDFIMDQNNTRFWLKRFFSEMALLTDNIQIVPYVHNTFTGEYIKVTTSTDIGAENDYLYAYTLAREAIRIANNIWDDEEGEQTVPRDGEIITIPVAGEVVLDDTCNEDPSEIFKMRSQNTPPETETSIDGNIRVIRRIRRNACGGYAIWLGGAGYLTYNRLIKHSPHQPCYGMIPYSASKNALSTQLQPLNTIETWLLPFAGAVSFNIGIKAEPLDDLILSPQNDDYLNGDPFEIKLKDGYEIEDAFYEKNFINAENTVPAIGLKSGTKETTIEDPANTKIDHLNLKIELDPLSFETNKLIPPNGSFRIRVCAKDTEQNYFESAKEINLVSHRLSKITDNSGRQSVIFDLNELETAKNAAIFVPGTPERGLIHNSGTGDSVNRIYEQEDLIFRDQKTNNGSITRREFFDRWNDFQTYIYHSLGYMESDVLGEDAYRIIADRILDNATSTDRVDFFDEYSGEVISGNEVAPQKPLWKADKEYFRGILDVYAAAAAADPSSPADDYNFRCDIPGQTGKKGRAIAMYVEDVSILRMLPTIRELLDEDVSGQYVNLHFVLGFLDPVWPDDHPDIGDVNQWLSDHVEALSARSNVTVFTAQSYVTTLRNKIYGTDGDEVLDKTIRYDLSFLDLLRIGNPINEGNNFNLLSKYMHALGEYGELGITYCSDALANPETEELGVFAGVPCWSTVRPNLGPLPYIGYKGPACGSLRNYFKDPNGFPGTSYHFKGLNFTSLTGNNIPDVFRLMEEDNQSRLRKIVLEIQNLRDADDKALETIVTGTGKTLQKGQ